MGVVCESMCMFLCVSVYVYVCTCVYMCACVYVCVYVCGVSMCVIQCMAVCMCMCMSTCLIKLSNYRSGLQTLPHSAKMHYNYANLMKDRNMALAVHHYREATRQVCWVANNLSID